MKREEYGDVCAYLNERGIKTELVEVSKNNKVKLHGIRLGDEVYQPVVYLEHINSKEEGYEIAKNALKEGEEYTEQYEDFIRHVSDYSYVKSHLAIKLTSDPLDEWVSEVAFCDIFKVPYIALSSELGQASVTITKSMLDIWDVDSNTLFTDALENTKKIFPAKIMSLLDVMREIDPEIGIVQEDSIPLMVVTNETKLQGASAILYADNLPGEFIMFPSSVHEVLYISEGIEEIINAERANNLVKEVNTTIPPTDILSNRAYYYKKGEWNYI